MPVTPLETWGESSCFSQTIEPSWWWWWMENRRIARLISISKLFWFQCCESLCFNKPVFFWMNCFRSPIFGLAGWSDAGTVMLAAAATHKDVSSTVYYAVWCRANYSETSPLRLPVAVHRLGVSPGPEVFLFLNADSAGSVSGCPHYSRHAINLWPQGILKSLSPSLKSKGLILTVFTTQMAQQLDGLLAALPGPLRYATYRYNLLYDVASFVSPAKGIQEALAFGKLRSSQEIYGARGRPVL